MTHSIKVYSKSGNPFSDKDAAEIKAQLMEEELGVSCSVETISVGQYVVLVEGGDDEGIDRPGFNKPLESGGFIDSDRYERERTQSIDHSSNPPEFSREDNPAKVEVAIDHSPPSSSEPEHRSVRKPENYPDVVVRPAMRSFVCQIVLGLVGLSLFISPLFPFDYYDIRISAHWINLVDISIRATAGALSFYYLLYVMLYLVSHSYRIRKESIESNYGIVFRNKKTVRIEDIKSTDIAQGILERMLGVGRIEIAAAATSGIDLVMHRVSNPVGYIREIEWRLSKIKGLN